MTTFLSFPSMPPLFHLTSCNLTKYNLVFASSRHCLQLLWPTENRHIPIHKPNVNFCCLPKTNIKHIKPYIAILSVDYLVINY
jgi:hypothetical protein